MQKEVLMSDAPKKNPNLQFHTANSNNELTEELANHIKANFQGSNLVFQPVHIITPNNAQHQWLKEKLAEKLGFIANLEQHSLRSFFKELIGTLDPITKDKPGKEKLIWKLFSEMGKTKFKDQFSKIKDYCGEDEIKRLALAQKLAGLFEDYLEYDPDGSWKELKDNEDLEWQLWLFNECGFAQLQPSPKKFLELITQNPGALKEYHSLYLFGNLDISPLHLEYLKAFSEVETFSIHIYRTHLNFEQKENPLAQNWGDHLVRTKEQLAQLGKLPENESLPEGKTLLAKIQKDILTDKAPKELPQDDSILIYNSFTRVREVEALYNYLVKTVDESGGELGARDIMVCMPSLDPYISAIRTVFDSAPYKFPYTLVSIGYGREESFWTALEQVLAFEKENFTAPAVFNLLEMQPIQKSFGFTDLDLLKKAFIDANIRREYEGDEELETNFASFSNGLNRLIYGFCLGSEEPVEIAGKMIYPVDIAEGQQANDLFRLHHLVELLNDFLKIKAERKSAADWHTKLMEIADQILQPEEWQRKQFLDLMLELGCMEASADEEIAFNTFFFRLKDQLHNKDLQQIKGHGGITFSGLYPGMSMPKKVVAFLGLNFKEFPRRSQELSFDLLPENKKPQSRIVDRGAFLETFLNADQKILLSYIGQNVKDNSEIPSSSLISELQDYAEKAGASIKEVIHPLHAFNSAYFDPENKDLFTYSSTRESISSKKGKKVVSVPEEIPLYVLEAFLKDPFKHHYNQVLKFYYEDAEMLPDWECFELDNLQEWSVKDRIKEERMKGEDLDIEELRKKMLLNSKIPLKNIGRSKLRETEERVAALWENVEEIKNGRSVDFIKDDLTITIPGGQKIKLKIELDSIGKDVLFLIVSKKDKLKYELSAYIRALALKAIGGSGILHYFCLDGNDPHYQEIQLGLSAEEAREELTEFAMLYVANFDRIIPFYPELDLKVDKLKDCEDIPNIEKTELIRGLIDERFDAWNSFFPSDYFIRECQQGFFTGVQGESNLLELKEITIKITEKVKSAFNKNN